jgi:hypothetical protein
MPAHPLMIPMRDLYGQPRDGYQGEFRPAVVEVREPMRTIHMRRSGNVVLLAIADGNGVSYWRVSNPDDPRLLALATSDRSKVHSALSALHREGGPADGNP